MKKFLSGVLVGALLTISGTALAAVEKIEAYFRPDFQVSVNGQVHKLKNAPITVNGSMYLPLREVGTILGYNVEWNEQTKTAELTEPAQPTQTPTQAKGDGNMEIKILKNYSSNEYTTEDAIKVNDTIYILFSIVNIEYAPVDYDHETNTFSIPTLGLQFVPSETISDQVDAFHYAGRAYVKESLIIEKFQPAN